MSLSPRWVLAEPQLPPANIEAEQALLGSIFLNNRAYQAVGEFLRPEHFANAVHGRIYAAIGDLIERGIEASPVSLKHVFDQDGALADIGGAGYLAKLAANAVTVSNAPHYGHAIHDLALRRSLILAGEEIIAEARSCDLHKPATTIANDYSERLAVVRASAAPFGITIASALACQPVPDRPWLVPDWIPRRQVTLLTGNGGVGKSLVAMQLQLAAAAARPWLGLWTMPCRSFGLYAEDEDDELHRRLVSLAELAGVDLSTLDNLAWRSATAEAAELVQVTERGAVVPTSYYREVERTIVNFGARLVILDAATNLYGGDEIKRRQVNQFIGLLRQLAIRIDGAVVLLAHPSNQGIATGTGLSGSTHWNNAVRSRLYFTRADCDDADPDPDARTLSRLKANYAGTGDVLRLRWKDGGFIPLDGPSGIDRRAIAARADRVFEALLAQSYAAGIWVSPAPTANSYAPTRFAKHPNREGIGKPAFEAAMHRLLNVQKIKTEKYGRPSDPRTRLAPA